MATSTSLIFQIFSRYDGSGMRQARQDIEETDNSTRRSTNSLNSWSGRLSLAATAAAAFGPALIPIGTAMVGVGAAAGVMAATTGGALGVYGAALKGAISTANSHGEAVKKTSGELAKQKAALEGMKPGTAAYAEQLKKVQAAQQQYNAALKDMTPAEKAYTTSVTNMKEAWQKFIAATSSKTLDTASHAVKGLTAGIGLLKPILDAVHPAINGVAKDFEAWMKSPSAKNYADLIKTAAVPALNNLIAAGKDVMRVLGDAFRALLPSSKSLSESIKEGADRLRQWADSGGFARFMDKVHQLAPSVTQFFKDVVSATGNLKDAFSGLSGPSLAVTDAIVKLMAAMPPGVIQAIAVGFVAIKTAMAGIAIYEGVTTAFAAGSTAAAIATGLWSAAETALIATMVAFDVAVAPAIAIMLLIVVAVAAIAFGIYELVKHWDTVWSHIKGAAEATGRWFSGPFVNFFKAIGDWFAGPFLTPFMAVGRWFSGPFVNFFIAAWHGIETGAKAVWNALKTAWNAVTGAFVTAWNATSNALKTAWNAVWNALKTAATTVWNALKTAWNAVVHGLQTAWTTVGNALKAAWTTVWNALKTAANTVWNWIKTAWNATINYLRTVWTNVSNNLKTAWQAVWNWLKTTAQTIWNAIKTAWQTVLNALKTIWDTVSGAIKTAWDAAWNWIKDTAQKIWDFMKQAWQTFTDGVKQIWDTASGVIKKAWEDTWNALKTTASDIWDKIKTVIQDAVNVVISIINGLIGAWNAVAGAVGLPTIGTIGKVGGGGGGGGGGAANGFAGGNSSGTGKGGVPGFAEGGIVNFAGGGVARGYAPGVDSIHAMVSPGEGILVPEAVQGLGADFVLNANAHFSGGRAGSSSGGFRNHFADGGIMGRMPHFAGGGFVSEIPTPGGGTVGQTPGRNLSNTGKDTGSGNSLGDLIPGIPGLPSIAEVTAQFMEWINKARSMTGWTAGMGGKVAGLGMQMLEKVVQAIQAKIAAMAKSILSKIGGAISGSVKGLSSLALNALKQAGIPASQLQNFLTRIQIESSGNPNAVNNWDINAQRGTPSMGLAQITTTNFAKFGSGNILNPADNLNAAANYIKAVYGNTVPTGRAYAGGTAGAAGGWAMVGEQGPEMINFRGGESVMSSHDLARAYRDGSAGNPVHLEMPIHVAGNLDKGAVEKLDNEVIPKLRIMLSKGTGTRLR